MPSLLASPVDDATRRRSVLSIPYAAKRLAPQLTAAAEGDPATTVTPR
ncbi:MAG: hypothetical protein M3228_14110 [Actinomycetota bacterium]|nr:hypothetical protein [Actinomycetota bacterium]